MTQSWEISIDELMSAGVHFGHQARRWNPKMRPFIFGESNGIHIIDLEKTQKLFKKSLEFIEQTVAEGGHVLFVATKKQAQDIIVTEANRAGMYHVHHRWLGGMLTNWQTVRARINNLKRIEKMMTDGTYDSMTKREVVLKERMRAKLERSIGGIKDMPGLPSILFIIDAKKEANAVLEAKTLHIPSVAVTDSNTNPDKITHVIPGNDDSVKAIQLYAAYVADAVIAGKKRRKAEFLKEDNTIQTDSGRGQIKVKRLKSRDDD